MSARHDRHRNFLALVIPCPDRSATTTITSFTMILLFITACLLIPTMVATAQEKTKKEPTKAENLSPDEKYLRDNLKDYLIPTKHEFLDDGKVKLVFDFTEKSEEQQGIFSCKFGNGMKAPFRWTINQEEWVIGGEKGLRISNRGIALINAWFEDDFEAEMWLLQHINHKSAHIAALVFCTDKGKILGSNYGSQCAYFSKTGKITKRQGKTEPVIFNQTGQIKLVVGDGIFEARRRNRKKAAAKYLEKYFKSGRIGFIWGGSMSGTITRLTITGKLDTETMVKKMKKALGDA